MGIRGVIVKWKDVVVMGVVVVSIVVVVGMVRSMVWRSYVGEFN